MRTNGIVNWKGVSTLTKAQNYELNELLSNLALQENCILEQFIVFWDQNCEMKLSNYSGNANFSLQMCIVSLYWEELWGSRWRISILRSRFIFRTAAAEGQRHTHIERERGRQRWRKFTRRRHRQLRPVVVIVPSLTLDTWDSNGKWQRFSSVGSVWTLEAEDTVVFKEWWGWNGKF